MDFEGMPIEGKPSFHTGQPDVIDPDSLPITAWLPISKKEMEKRGWEQADIILLSGDAYVDHPSFGIAVIGRYLEHAGYKVAILPQPNWKDDLRDFKKLGRPRLFFGISAEQRCLHAGRKGGVQA